MFDALGMCVCRRNKIKSLKEKTWEKHVRVMLLWKVLDAHKFAVLQLEAGSGWLRAVGGTRSRCSPAWPGPLWGLWP